MIKGKWICLMIPVLILITVISAFGNESLDKMILSKVQQYYSLNRDDIEFEIKKNRLEIELSGFDSLTVSPMTNKEPRGLVPLKVEIYSGNEIIESAQIRVDIRYFGNVLVTTDRIKRNHQILNYQVREERRDLTYITDKPIVNPVELRDVWTRRTISKNQILTNAIIEKIPVLTSGEEVSVTYQIAGLDIRTKGVVLENGYVGDEIRVRNNDSKKIIPCTIVDNETVRVSSN